MSTRLSLPRVTEDISEAVYHDILCRVAPRLVANGKFVSDFERNYIIGHVRNCLRCQSKIAGYWRLN